LDDEQPKRRRRRRHRSGEHHSRRRRRRSSRETPNLDYRALAPVDTFETWLLVTFGYWLLMLFLMHAPGGTVPVESLTDAFSDRWLHGMAFFVLAFMVTKTAELWTVRGLPGANPPAWIYAVILVGCLIYGYVDEATQPLTGRTYDTADWEADAIGSVTGICAALFIQIFLRPDNSTPPHLATYDEHRRRRRKHRRHRRRSGESRASETPPAAEFPGAAGSPAAETDEPPVDPPPPATDEAR
jgi:hypothetical protein